RAGASTARCAVAGRTTPSPATSIATADRSARPRPRPRRWIAAPIDGASPGGVHHGVASRTRTVSLLYATFIVVTSVFIVSTTWQVASVLFGSGGTVGRAAVP